MDDFKQIISELNKDIRVKNFISSSAKSLATKLNEEIEKGNDTKAFLIALLLAILKDSLDIILDIFLIGEIPGIGFIPGLFLTSFLFFFMLGKGWFLEWKIKFWYWVLGFFVDGLPLINALPMNTLLVLDAWRITRRRAKKAKLKLKNLNTLSDREIRDLEADISLLESI